MAKVFGAITQKVYLYDGLIVTFVSCVLLYDDGAVFRRTDYVPWIDYGR